MTPELLTLLGVGLVGGFFSGLLGIGGGVLMVPLLLYVPPLLGIKPFDIKTTTGITMVQSLAGSLAGLIIQHKNNYIHRQLALAMGIPAVISSLLGAVLSKQISGAAVYAVFAGLALVAAVMMLLPKKITEENPSVVVEDINFSKPLAVLAALLIGLAGGIIGQGGAFLMIPVMLYFFKIPTRLALGSSAVVAFLSAGAGFLGKWGTGQVPLAMAVTVAVGAVVGAQLGGYAGKRMQTQSLRFVLGLLLAGTALRMWYGLSETVFIGLSFALFLLCIAFLVRKFRLRSKKETVANIGLQQGRDSRLETVDKFQT